MRKDIIGFLLSNPLLEIYLKFNIFKKKYICNATCYNFFISI